MREEQQVAEVRLLAITDGVSKMRAIGLEKMR